MGGRSRSTVLEGKLVRILDGRTWDLTLAEGGHAGLEGVLREYEGQDVVIKIERQAPRVKRPEG